MRSNKALEPVVDVEGTCVSMQTEDLCVPLLDEVAVPAEVRYAALEPAAVWDKEPDKVDVAVSGRGGGPGG